MKNKKNNFGFTLFELLVTISIIAVLTAVAVVSFGGVNKKARDSRRMADLEKIRIALEAVKQVGSSYPTTGNAQAVLVPTYLQQWPTDPKTKVAYSYTGLTSYTYQIGTSMENPDSVNCTSSCGCTGCNYKVVNP
ncbi:MAG: type II secretion system protein [Candidatus Shapirobacteria bacterium]|nr:type II secretion system protein [Candidatus Shapirobacteria bacterium]